MVCAMQEGAAVSVGFSTPSTYSFLRETVGFWKLVFFYPPAFFNEPNGKCFWPKSYFFSSLERCVYVGSRKLFVYKFLLAYNVSSQPVSVPVPAVS